MTEFKDGDRVTKTGYRSWYQGTFYRYETKFRTLWAVVHWDGKQFTDREYPHAIEPLVKEVTMTEEPAKTTPPKGPHKPGA